MPAPQLNSDAWHALLDQIRWGKCTPFLGAGVNFPFLPTGKAIALKWAAEHDYPPLEGKDDLARVAQFLAIKRGGIWPKRRIVEEFQNAGVPDLSANDNPLAVLAGLPIPIYITTNYDNYLIDALRMKGKKPRLELCRWNSALSQVESVFSKKSRFDPSEEEPVVFHVHGHVDRPESLVLTEDDYLEFLVNLSRNQALIAPRIQRALGDSSLLFIGYRLADWDLRVLLHGVLKPIEKSLRSLSISVQLPPDLPSDQLEAALSYLEKYFGELKVSVFWGTAREFAGKLRKHREALLPAKDADDAAEGSAERNPYPGPRPFEGKEQDVFCGRDYESEEVFSLTIAHQAVLLYAQSGAGKTSLLNAGLAPRLRKRGFLVLPTALIRTPISDAIRGDGISNPYVLATLLSWAENTADPRQLADLSINQFLKNRRDANDETGRALIFDQFEDLFTLYPSRWRERGPFFEQLAEALASDPSLRVSIGMREEYLGQLNAYAHLFPDGLETRFRLERLDADSAREAITKPLKSTHRSFSRDAENKLTDDLLKVRVTVDQETTKELAGEYVEPVQLQVVCQELWNSLPAKVQEITVEHLREFGNVTEALSGYYTRSVEKAVRQAGVKEGKLRDWFEQTLITAAGTRGTVFRGSNTTGGIPNQAIDVLEHDHLVRRDSRAGAEWYELTHDRFIEPILESNARWRKARGNANQTRQRLEDKAANWEGQGRREADLLSGTELEDAALWLESPDAAELGYSDAVRGLLSASTMHRRQMEERQRRIEEQAQATRRFRRYAILSAALGAIALLAFVWAYLAQQTTASVGRAAEAVSQLRTAPDLSVLLAMQAMKAEATPQAFDALNRSLHALRLKRTLTEHSDRVTGVAFSHDGKMLASASEDHTARIWDTSTWKVLQTLQTGLAGFSGIAFSPDGTRLVTAGQDANKRSFLELWDVRAGERLEMVRCLHQITAAIYHPSQPVIATVEGEYKDRARIYIWDAKAKLGRIGGWRSDTWISGLAFNPEGSQLASAGYDGIVRIWPLATCGKTPVCKPLWPLKGNTDHVKGVAFSPDGQLLASAGMDSTVRIWNANGGNPRTFPAGHVNSVFAVEFDSSGRLASASADALIKVWDPESGRELLRFAGHSGPVEAAAFNPSGSEVVSASWDKTLKVWNAQSHSGRITDLGFTPDGQLATASIDGSVKLWDSTSGDERKTIPAWDTPHEVSQVRISKDGSLLAIEAQRVHLWDVNGGKYVPDFRGSADKSLWSLSSVSSISFNPRAAEVATGDNDGSVSLWALPRGALIRELGHQDTAIESLAFSPKETLVVSADTVGNLRLWRTASEDQKPVPFSAHKSHVSAVVFSSDGAMLATASADGTARLWSVDSGGQLHQKHEFTGHSNTLSCIAFSPDNKYLATGSWDRTAKIWNLTSFKVERSFTHETGVNAVAFSPDGKILATATEDTTPHLNLLDREELMRRARERMRGLNSVLNP